MDSDGDVGLVDGVAARGPRVAIGAAVLRPVLRRAAQDAEEQRQTELDGPQDRLRAAAGAEPDAQRLLRPGHDERALEGPTPMRAAPGDALVAVEREQQLELGAVE